MGLLDNFIHSVKNLHQEMEDLMERYSHYDDETLIRKAASMSGKHGIAILNVLKRRGIDPEEIKERVNKARRRL